MINDLDSYAAGIFRPRKDQKVYEWCEENVVIPAEISQDGGAYSTLMHPYVREPLECFRDLTVENVILIWGSQTAKTTTLAMGNLWAVEHDPVTTMCVIDTAKNAEKFSRDRWQPLVENSPIVKLLGTDRGDNNTLEKRFDTMSLYFVGSNSAGNLASVPAGRIIADEIDKYPKAKANESSAVKLLESRTKTYKGAKSFWSSTPTTEEGAINQKWNESDKRYFNIPCPNCDEGIVLSTKGLLFPPDAKDAQTGEWDYERVLNETVYCCEKCNGIIDDSDKLKAMRSGEWVSTSKGVPRTRGYHLHSLYSPKITFGQCAVEFLKSKDSSEAMQNYTNSWEAEIWKDRIIEVKETQLIKCEGEYHRLDRVGKVRTLCVDIQRNDFRYNIRGYDTKSLLIDWGTCQTWDDIRELQLKYDCEYVGIDTQFPDRQQEAFTKIFEYKEVGWIAIEGKGKGQGLYSKLYDMSLINPFVGERKKNVSSRDKIKYLKINSDVWKGEMARKRNAEAPEWKVYQDIEKGYSKELYGEYQVKVLRRGRPELEWKVKSHRQNHQFDLECYQLALAHYLKLKPYDHGRIRNIFEAGEDEPTFFKPVATPDVNKSDTVKDGKEIEPKIEVASFFKPVANR